MESSGKYLMILGLILFIAGLLLTFSQRLPFKLGRLPGDIAIEKAGVHVYLPITTMLLISVVLSLVAWAVSRFNR